MHEGSASDFSLGGGLSILHTDFDAPDDEVTDIHLEGSGKIRLSRKEALGKARAKNRACSRDRR